MQIIIIINCRIINNVHYCIYFSKPVSRVKVLQTPSFFLITWDMQDGAVRSSGGRGSHLRMHNILQQSLYAQYNISTYTTCTHICMHNTFQIHIGMIRKTFFWCDKNLHFAGYIYQECRDIIQEGGEGLLTFKATIYMQS